MEIIKRVFQQTGFQLVGKVITTLSSVLILGIITRNFGEEGTGVLTLALTYLAFFATVEDFGVNAHLLPRFLGEENSLEWRKLFGLRIFLAILLIIIGLLGIFVYPSSQVLFKQLVFVGIIFAILEPAIFVSSNLIFQAKLRYDLSTVAWGVGSLGTLGTIYFLVGKGFGLLAVIGGYILGWVLISGLSLILIKKFVSSISPILDIKYIKKTFLESWPISLALILNVLYFRVDTFILSLYKSFAEVGVYNLAYQVFQSSLVLPTFIMNGFYPILLKEFSENKVKFLSLLKKSFGLMVVLGMIGLFGSLIFSRLVIFILAGGKGFLGSTEALRILGLGYPAFFASSLLMWVLVVLKKYKSLVGIYFFGLGVNFLLNSIFIPQYSYLAAAYITGVSEYLILVLQLGVVYKELI